MSAMTNYFENKLIDFLFRGQALGVSDSSAAALSGPNNLFVGLYTESPTDVGGGTEVTGGAYARVPVACTLANWAGTQGYGTTTVSSGTSGTTSNNVPVVFPAPTANWGVIVGSAIFDAATGGNPLLVGALAVNKTINLDDNAPSFAAGKLLFKIDN